MKDLKYQRPKWSLGGQRLKWFKHYTDASLDDKMERVEAEFGLIGYAAYFKILEICAAQFDGKDQTTFYISLVRLQNQLRMKSKRIHYLFNIFSELGFWKSKINGNIIEINLPKLQEIKDNHTKNLQASGNKKPEKFLLDKDKDIYKELDQEYIHNSVDQHSIRDPYFDQTTHTQNEPSFRNESFEILTFLNEKANKIFRPSEVNLYPIREILKTGASIQDCKTVIARKVREWKDDKEMNKFLRPITIFNKIKFEQYLGECVEVKS